MSSNVDDLYTAQIRPLADSDKIRLVELIAHDLVSQNGGRPASDSMSAPERQAARERFHQHAGRVSLGHATGASNESIDEDLSREYGSGTEHN